MEIDNIVYTPAVINICYDQQLSARKRQYTLNKDWDKKYTKDPNFGIKPHPITGVIHSR
jgi:hypothetical protein